MDAQLLQLLTVVVVARAASEIAERIRIPAVLAEIAAGLLLGPSVAGVAHTGPTLRLLGNIGAILLLFEVGLHMSPRDLRRAGRGSMQVATIGVIAPMAVGLIAMRAMGLDGRAALFLAAGITATSVGITARVFSDLRMLASAEARTVLGAAVADDVMGLMILAVVMPLGTGAHLKLSSLIVGPVIAIGFVVVASLVGAKFAPSIFGAVASRARADGSLTGASFGFAIALGIAAAAAGLAPIVGAFVAGVALSDGSARDEVHHRLVPVGHLLIPLFFAQIGIETQIRSFADPWVLGIGAILTVIAVAGKIVAGIGAPRGTADRWLVGISMIPRGEVGLIFASLGLAHGALDQRTHAVLLLVVFISTLGTPPLIRRRARALRRHAAGATVETEPAEGWLRVTPDEVELRAEPPEFLAGPLALDAALGCTGIRRPGARLLEWLRRSAENPVVWDEGMRRRLFALLRDGTVRGWRFLEVTGMLAVLLPALDGALRARMRDPFELDPSGALRWEELDGLSALVARDLGARDELLALRRHDIVLLAALVRSAFADDHAAEGARSIASLIGLDPESAEFLVFLVAERRLLQAAAARAHGVPSEDEILELAAHIKTRERAAALYVLALAAAHTPEEREAMRELHALVAEALEHPELIGGAAEDLVEQRRAAASAELRAFPEEMLRPHLDAAPRRYLLAQPPEAIAMHLRMMQRPLAGDEVRLRSEHLGGARWRVHVVMSDRQGTLASLAWAFLARGISVEEAVLSSWRTGIAIDVFTIGAPDDTDWAEVAREARVAIRHGERASGAVEGSVELDNLASPWHSVLDVRARDREGVLARVSSAIARTGGQIHHAVVHTVGVVAVDRFLVTGRRGGKFDEQDEAELRLALSGAPSPRRGLRRRSVNTLVTRT